ncbi:hypothetical protein Pcinc_033728 [Petrolisthes cinctipes]|uniref:Sarcolemmal membrane-associated protein n=1 Tax=Petrolisthes cinctipes TaxID=88211 RepID=A0AAE1ERQ5_PETCI|nr:hypothetical protein Pcinc_033728 [Petrolisthes cinctipes]
MANSGCDHTHQEERDRPARERGERTLVLDQPVKIGRSVARARPATNNAIFDCKVLSRNHALLWYENGKFYLQDTKSSNGTFVNNQRLSKGSEESAPREVCSGDIVQFGVDVMENSRKVTHGCIVATLKLYMPDGQEAKASPSTAVGGAVSSVTAQELYQLRTYLQEAQHREQQIESKLATLQRLVSSTQEAATHSWKAMIDEDRLLQRLETLEAQLTTYAKNYPEDSVREEMRRVLEEKCQSESTAKESIRRILEEKLEAVTKLADLERTVSGSENEVSHMRGVCEGAQRELAHLLDQQAAHNEQVAQLTEKLKLAEEEAREAAEGHEQEVKEMEAKLAERVADEAKLQARLESVAAEGDFTKEQLSALKAKYENIKNGEISSGGGGGSALIRTTTKDLTDLDLSSIEPGDMRVALESSQRETHNLRARLQDAQDQLRQAQANVSQLKREAAVADSAEAACLTTRSRLQEELCEAKGVSAGSVALTKHLQDQIGELEERLRDSQGLHHPKIYDDIYDDNTSTLVRKKKDLPKDRDKLNEDDAKDSEEDEEEEERTKDIEEDPDNTLTIIPTKDNNAAIITTPKECLDSNVNGSLEDKEEKESSLAEENTVRADIKRLQELLDGSRAAQVVAEREVERVRGELAQASSSAITASHEASNLRQQLAASEALVSEKMAAVGWLQGQVRRLEEAGSEVRSQLATITSRLREEQQRAATAHQQTHTLRDKLSEAEKLAQATVEEAEMLKRRIAGLEERLEVYPTSSSSTPLILPPSSSGTLNVSSSTSSSSSSSSSSQERVEEDSPSNPHRGLQQNPETLTNEQPISTSATVTEVLKNGVNSPGSQDEALVISGGVNSEAVVTELRDKMRKLQRELSETRRECSDLKDKERTMVEDLEGGDKTRRRRTDEGDGKQQQEMDGLVAPISEKCPDSTGGPLGSRTSLEAEVAMLREERDSLRKKLGLITEDYQLLSVQNKTAVALSLVPLCLLLLGFITAFYDTVSAFTATTEYHPPPELPPSSPPAAL